MSAGADECRIAYHRRGDQIRLTLTGVTNHELREVLVGLWARLDHADRVDHTRELEHYASMLRSPRDYPERFLSPVAQAIKDGPEGERAIDLAQRRAEEERQ